MTEKVKYKWDIFGFVKSIVLVGLIVLAWVKWDDIMSQIDQFGSKPPPAAQVIKIDDNATRLELIASNQRIRELERQLKEMNSKILQVVEDRNERIEEIGIITAKLEQAVKLQQKSDHVYLTGKKTDHHFIKIYRKASDGSEFPDAWAMFHPNQDDPNKLWKTGTYPLEFHAEIIETESDSGKFNRYVEVNVENNQMKETKGNRYPIPLTEVKWAKRQKTSKSFQKWNPRLGLGGAITDDFAAPALDISLMSYGRTKTDMDWRFITLGVGAQNGDNDRTEPVLTFTPFQWNFGRKVPLIENAFIGPVIGRSDGKTSYGVGLSIPF